MHATIELTLADINRYHLFGVADMDTGEILLVHVDRLSSIGSLSFIGGDPLIKPDHVLKIIIISSHDTRNEAINAGHKFISEYFPNGRYPKLNSRGMLTRVGAVVCNETGVRYLNAAQAADSCGIHRGAMSLHLRRKPGYKTLKGLTFSYPEQPSR